VSRAWEIGDEFGLEHLRLADHEVEEPARGQVRVAVRACSLNYRDLLMVRGLYDPRLKKPITPLSDGVGVVEAVGPDVTRVAVGDRVLACFAPRWFAGAPERATIRHTIGGPLPGMLRQHALLDAEGVVKAPAHLTDEEAATLPCAALTAWSALVTLGELHAGQTILVQGTGGVSIFALQLAKLLGLRVILTSSDEAKRQRAEALGAWQTLDYRAEPKWGKKVAELSDGGVDLVVEVGGAGTLAQSIRAVKPGGTIALIGNLSGNDAEMSLVRVLMNQVRVQGVLVGHREGFEAMNRAVALHRMRPVVDRTFPFEEAPDAFRHLKSQKHFGKVCVRVSE